MSTSRSEVLHLGRFLMVPLPDDHPLMKLLRGEITQVFLPSLTGEGISLLFADGRIITVGVDDDGQLFIGEPKLPGD